MLGADIVVPRGDGFADAVREHFPNGVDGLADGSVQNEAVFGAIADGGAFTSVRGFKGEPQRDIRFSTTWVTSYAEDHARLDQLREQAEAGSVTLRVAQTYPAEDAAEAHRRLEAGGTRGRCVITFSDEA